MLMEARVHNEVNGDGDCPAIVLMDQHRVLCNITACWVPAMSTVISSSDSLGGTEKKLLVTSVDCLSTVLSRVPITPAVLPLHGGCP